ncbi:hypothetical protein CYMTET_47733 [Cymbomonas tetramitiformis]|uniref:Apple domain-containing protein n=1 Tax=Cymbomonas tetramitiformis TaxID=36881 RepID=A0AAE0EWB4_9CHLO|nr:hypothetical protein CYMTET_47733 [Cymbomonas tetramitiformis]|eukprot:gene417-773_t
MRAFLFPFTLTALTYFTISRTGVDARSNPGDTPSSPSSHDASRSGEQTWVDSDGDRSRSFMMDAAEDVPRERRVPEEESARFHPLETDILEVDEYNNDETDTTNDDRYATYVEDDQKDSDPPSDDEYEIVGYGICRSVQHYVVVYDAASTVSPQTCHSECVHSEKCGGFAHMKGTNRCLIYKNFPSESLDFPCSKASGECFVCYKLKEESDSTSDDNSQVADTAENVLSEGHPPEEDWNPNLEMAVNDPREENEATPHIPFNLIVHQYAISENPFRRFSELWLRSADKATDGDSDDRELRLDEISTLAPELYNLLRVVDRDDSYTIDQTELVALAFGALDKLVTSEFLYSAFERRAL